MKRKIVVRLLFSGLIVLLVFGNPSEDRFLTTIAKDFTAMHHGVQMDVSTLQKLGNTQYKSYLFFSTYHYAFGQISVDYVGLGFMTFHLKSSASKTTEEHPITS